MSLSRPDFDVACKSLIGKYATHPSVPQNIQYKDWSWSEHSVVPGLGFLSRTTVYHRLSRSHRDDSELDVEQDIDVATASVPSFESLTCRQYVVYSATFRVPTFYFMIHDSTGSPLTISDLIASPLLRPFHVPVEVSSFAITRPASAFPLLSQGDHPTLGTPSWYIHPCETVAAVSEIMSEVADETWDREQLLVRTLEAWFMVVGSVVNFSSLP